MVEDIASGKEGLGFDSRSNRTVATVVSSELCCLGAKRQKWTSHSLHVSANSAASIHSVMKIWFEFIFSKYFFHHQATVMLHFISFFSTCFSSISFLSFAFAVNDEFFISF